MIIEDENDRFPPADDALARLRSEHRQQLIELQHRTRNALGVMRSLIRRTAESSDTLEDFALHIEGRLDALTRTQAAIARTPNAGIDLITLLATEFTACQAREDDQVSLDGPPVELTAKAALSLGLAFQELTTNAIKYGALSAKGGHVSVRWNRETAEDADRLVILWQERGGPRITSSPAKTGFGTELLTRTLGYELHAEVALVYDPDGLRCSLRLPFTELVFTEETLTALKSAGR